MAKSSTRLRSRTLVRDLRSSPPEVDSFCREVREFLTGIGLSGEIFPVEMLLREGLNNAMIHGNGGNTDKRIRAEVRATPKWIVLQITDEGEGFDHRKIRKAVPDPEAVSGRGMAIYSLYASRVSFNSTGNRVSLWRAVTGDMEP